MGTLNRFALLLILFTMGFGAFAQAQRLSNVMTPGDAPIVRGTPKIDGQENDPVWFKQEWRQLDQNWMGATPPQKDFKGLYKLAWDDSCLYILAAIWDDTLVDTHPNPLDRYWDDDCLEIFLDEDASGGNHQYSHQAFAYHLSLNGKDVADVDTDSNFILLNPHVQFVIDSTRTANNKELKEFHYLTFWECKVRIYSSRFKVGMEKQTRKGLKKGQKIGFALAYCDNDHSKERENFMGSVPVAGEDKNRGWIDASIFQTLILQ